MAVLIVISFILVTIIYVIQGVRSSYRLYTSHLGYQVRQFDVTPSWIGTKNLIVHGINPYSRRGEELIEEAYFGRILRAEDNVGDKQHFAYPLHVVLVYFPTVFLSFSNALLIIWLFSFGMVIASSCLWLKTIWPTRKNKPMLMIGLSAFFLSWPQMYIALQTRQPLIIVLFLTILAILWIDRIHESNEYIYSIITGLLIFMSTIKPQSSLLSLAYIFVIWLPSTIDRQRVWHVWQGFVIAGVVSLAITLWLVPGWMVDFLQTIISYREYAGSTGSELLVGKGWVSVSISALFIAVGFIMSLVSYRKKQKDLHYLVFAYVFLLQGFVFPAHLYVIIMAIPLVTIAIQYIFEIKERTLEDWLILIVLIIATYTTYQYWFSIFNEAGFPLPDVVVKMLGTIDQIRPSVPLYAAIPLMLVLGILLFIQSAKHSVASPNLSQSNS